MSVLTVQDGRYMQSSTLNIEKIHLSDGTSQGGQGGSLLINKGGTLTWDNVTLATEKDSKALKTDMQQEIRMLHDDVADIKSEILFDILPTAKAGGFLF